jgi:hypothetical protein
MKEDNFSKTVDAAAYYAQKIAEHEAYYEDEGDRYEPEDDEEDEAWEDRCNCSDPGCPCGGWKTGGL